MVRVKVSCSEGLANRTGPRVMAVFPRGGVASVDRGGYGTTTTMAYDAWGRMTSKTDGTYSAMPKAAAKRSRGAPVVEAQRNHESLAYRYGDKLYSVTSDFPSEGTVTYEYGGDQKRMRSRNSTEGQIQWQWQLGGQCGMDSRPLSRIGAPFRGPSSLEKAWWTQLSQGVSRGSSRMVGSMQRLGSSS